MQKALLVSANVPGSQRRHAPLLLAPTAAFAVPAGQEAHENWPGTDEYVPASQSKQVTSAPLMDANCPEAQLVCARAGRGAGGGRG